MKTNTRAPIGTAIATTAALLFAAAPTTTVRAEEGDVQCLGINACKGQSACMTATNACKGQNACKAKGFSFAATEKECTEKGGRVIK